MDTQPPQPSVPTPAPTSPPPMAATPPPTPATSTPKPASKGWLWVSAIALVLVFVYGAAAYFSGMWPFGAEPKATESPSATTGAELPPAKLSWSQIAVGTQMGSMTVVDIRRAHDRVGSGPAGYIVELQGSLTITGEYTPFDPALAVGPSFIPSLHITDPDSLSRIPRIAEDTRSVWFMFDNSEAVASALGSQGGTATVTINRYEINMLESAVANVGTFVAGSLDPTAEWENFSSKYFTLSFKVPSGYFVKEWQNLLQVGIEPYVPGDGEGIGSAVLSINRYPSGYTKEQAIADYRKGNPEARLSTIVVDGTSFTRGDSEWNLGNGIRKTLTVFFEKSSFMARDETVNGRPDLTESNITIATQILSTFRFTQ